MRMRVVVALAALVAPSGCSYTPPGGDDDAGRVTIVEDSAEDLADAEELTEGRVTPEGVIEPHAFVLGGLRARGFQAQLVPAPPAWTELEAAIAADPTVARGTSYAQLPANWGNARPEGLHLTTSDGFTVVFEGEIELAAGDNAIEIDADDTGILELDTGDGFGHTLIDDTGGPKSITVPAPRAGWYPIRLAIGDGGGNAKLDLRLGGMPVAPAQLRAKVADERGLIVQAFSEHGHLGPLPVTTSVAAVDAMFGQVEPPFDLGVGTRYQLRYLGQIYIDEPGTWTLAVTTADLRDTTRLWIDRRVVAITAADDTATAGFPPAATLDLTEGWHALAIDLSASQVDDRNSPIPHDVSIAFTATPPGGSPAPVPTERLRPVVDSGLVGAVFDLDNVQLKDADTTDVPLALPELEGAVIDAIDVFYVLIGGDPEAYDAVLEAGAASLAVDPVDFGNGASGMVVLADATFAGAPADAAWRLRFTDTAQGGSSATLDFAFLDVTAHGGPAMPFAPVVTYVSSVLATPGARRVLDVRTRGTLGGATQTVELRTAATADELAAAPFTRIDGALPLPAGELLQYRIVLQSDGWEAPTLDAIEIDYTTVE